MVTLRNRALLAALAFVIAVTFAQSREGRKEYRSPDGELTAAIIPVDKANESRVDIRNSRDKLFFTKDYSSKNMEHGQVIA